MVNDCRSGGLQQLHVLAVDDSDLDRKVIERLLKVSSCKVTAVESGRRALQYLGLDGEKNSVGIDDSKVNLIMTDYSMPGMTGFELLQRIKGSSKLKEIPVVIMSSENIMARVDRCLEEGAERFLVKPVKLMDVQRLKDCILSSPEEENRNEDFQRLEDCILSSPEKKNRSEDVQREKECILSSPEKKNRSEDVQREKECILSSPEKKNRSKDVQREKDCILSSPEEKNGRETTRKRKFMDDSCLPFLAPPATPPPSLICDDLLSPRSVVSTDTHQPLAKCPALMAASD